MSSYVKPAGEEGWFGSGILRVKQIADQLATADLLQHLGAGLNVVGDHLKDFGIDVSEFDLDDLEARHFAGGDDEAKHAKADGIARGPDFARLLPDDAWEVILAQLGPRDVARAAGACTMHDRYGRTGYPHL